MSDYYGNNPFGNKKFCEDCRHLRMNQVNSHGEVYCAKRGIYVPIYETGCSKFEK